MDRVGRLPVAEDRDDELSRLGHTLNDLLARIEAGGVRERQFLADASHELRSPLALMSTEVEWARHRQRSPEEMARVLASLRAQVARLVGLTDALLEVEELRAVGPIVREEVALRALVGDAVRDAQLAGSEVETHVEDVVVVVNRRWLTIALTNLLTNATRHGAAPVVVSATWADGQLRVVVADHGPGVPEDFRDVAFDRFSRAERSRTTPGSGLGLHLVGAVAQAHDGAARLVESEQGATFEIDVPAEAHRA